MLVALVVLAVSSPDIAIIAASILSGGATVAIVQAISQRRKVGADATAVVTAAARELVDPLRKELAQEREDNAKEVAAERAKVAEMRQEMENAIKEARVLRKELHDARLEADAMRLEREVFIKRIRHLEAEISADDPPTDP